VASADAFLVGRQRSEAERAGTRLLTFTLEADLWYRSMHQIGLTVDDYGDGPLVLSGKPAELEPPHGSGYQAEQPRWELQLARRDRLRRAEVAHHSGNLDGAVLALVVLDDRDDRSAHRDRGAVERV
jgi:hypothetical protein